MFEFSKKKYLQAYLKYIEDHYPGLPRNLISTLYASEDDALKLHGPHICSSEDMIENCEIMNRKITKDLLMPESFGLKLDEDEVEFIGRLLSFDRSSSSHVFTIPESTIFFHRRAWGIKWHEEKVGMF